VVVLSVAPMPHDPRYTRTVQREDGVVASALEVLDIAEVDAVQASPGVFTAGERAYAESKSDPPRRLAARLAAKRAACRLLGEGVRLGEVEVVSRGGPPRLHLAPRAAERLRQLGASATLVSLTHGRTHAAAAVLLLERGVNDAG
jgi:holo-[acyl-carrier protein] synthase